MKCKFEKHSVFIDDVETPILSGAIHYFRTFPEQWHDRLLKLKQCGYNTVETYAAWHLHEVREGEYNFQGRLDIGKFIKTAGDLGLMVIVRPGPYICSECDLGGLPGWLLGKAGLRLRCDNGPFLHHVREYFTRLMAIIKPLQCTHGGPVIAMQVENEYGSYAADKTYLKKLRGIIEECGIDIQLFTSDGDNSLCLGGGTLPDLPATINFRNRPEGHFKTLDQIATGYENPHFTMELWVGKAWHWGVPPQHHPDGEVAEDIRYILKSKSSANCYMFHGGTNFGFTSGANYSNKVYMPLITSYEVDTILDESGKTTSKYDAIQKVVEEFHPGTTCKPINEPAIVPASTELDGYVSLLDSLEVLSQPIQSSLPETMETFGQTFGFILYTTTLKTYLSGTWEMQNMRDRAIVMIDGNPVATIYRNDPDKNVSLLVRKDGEKLNVLIENMGRINFGPEMEAERKGMTGFIRGCRHLSDWTIRPLPMDDISGLAFKPLDGMPAGPGYYHGTFQADKSGDVFLKNPQGIRGYVWINGFNVGRYWNIGPQYTLYIPKPLVKPGKNEIVVFDTNGLYDNALNFAPSRIIGPMSDMIL